MFRTSRYDHWCLQIHIMLYWSTPALPCGRSWQDLHDNRSTRSYYKHLLSTWITYLIPNPTHPVNTSLTRSKWDSHAFLQFNTFTFFQPRCLKPNWTRTTIHLLCWLGWKFDETFIGIVKTFYIKLVSNSTFHWSEQLLNREMNLVATIVATSCFCMRLPMRWH